MFLLILYCYSIHSLHILLLVVLVLYTPHFYCTACSTPHFTAGLLFTYHSIILLVPCRNHGVFCACTYNATNSKYSHYACAPKGSLCSHQWNGYNIHIHCPSVGLGCVSLSVTCRTNMASLPDSSSPSFQTLDTAIATIEPSQLKESDDTSME